MNNSTGSSIVRSQESCYRKACGRGDRAQDQGRDKKGKADGNFKFQVHCDFYDIPISTKIYVYLQLS